MKVCRLFFPGQFEDAYLYMSRLLILREDQTILIKDLDALIRDLSQKLEAPLALPTLLFSRNDWLAGEQFQAYARDPHFVKALEAELGAFPQPFCELSVEKSQPQDIGIHATVVLDWEVYNSRLYVGSDLGLHHLDIDWLDHDGPLSSPEKRLDARCQGISVKYGSVNASCGNDGLFTSFDEFGRVGYLENGHLRHLAERSLKTAWTLYDLVNYSAPTHPALLRFERESVGTGQLRGGRVVEREQAVLTGLASIRDDLADSLMALAEHAIDESVLSVFNSGSRFFAISEEGTIMILALDTRNSSTWKRLQTTRTVPGVGRILDAKPSALGLVVETMNSVQLFTDDAWLPLLDSPALSVRTFPRSRRYRNLVSVVTEEGLFLIGLFDNRLLQTV